MFKVNIPMFIGSLISVFSAVHFSASASQLTNIMITGTSQLNWANNLEQALIEDCHNAITCGNIGLISSFQIKSDIRYHYGAILEDGNSSFHKQQIISLYQSLLTSNDVSKLTATIGSQNIEIKSLTLNQIYGDTLINQSVSILSQPNYQLDNSNNPQEVFTTLHTHWNISEEQWLDNVLNRFNISAIANALGKDVNTVKEELKASSYLFDLDSWINPLKIGDTNIDYIIQEPNNMLRIGLVTSNLEAGISISRYLQNYVLEYGGNPDLVPTNVEVYPSWSGAEINYNGRSTIIMPEVGDFNSPVHEIIIQGENIPEPSTVLGLVIFGLTLISYKRPPG